MSSDAGVIIYKAFAPTLKMLICIAIGFVVTKQGYFPPASAKGVSTLSLNIGLPALIFSSMVTAFTPENISAFGSLAVVAVLYQSIGAFLAWLIREFFFVPADFQWAGALSNWGNLPIAVVQVVAKSAPFAGETDVELGVAYISVFVLIFNSVFFPFGIHKLCALDFREENLARVQLPLRARWTARLKLLLSLTQKAKADTSEDESPSPASTAVQEDGPVSPGVEKRDSVAGSEYGERGEALGELKHRARFTGGILPTRKTSRTPSFTSMLEGTRSIPVTAPLDATDIASPCVPPSGAPLLPVCSNHDQTYTYHQPTTPSPSMHKPTFRRRLVSILKSFVMPVTIATLFGIPCSVVLPLKALFTYTDGWTGGRLPNAPDGNPPLAFILETATFLGGMTVPAALILLGASFARLKMPSNWRELPLAAIIALTISKMIIIPVFGIFVVQALRDKTGLYPSTDKVRIFVAILLSGTPAAVNQLVVTQLYNPAGTAHTLAMFLLLQYICMPILSTALAAIAIYICG